MNNKIIDINDDVINNAKTIAKLNGFDLDNVDKNSQLAKQVENIARINGINLTTMNSDFWTDVFKGMVCGNVAKAYLTGAV